MNINLTKRTGLWVIVLLLVASPVERLEAHGGGNWDPFTIDTVNNGARDRLLALQALMSEVIRGRIGGDTPERHNQSNEGSEAVLEVGQVWVGR